MHGFMTLWKLRAIHGSSFFFDRLWKEPQALHKGIALSKGMAQIEIDPLDGLQVPPFRWGQYVHCGGDLQTANGWQPCREWIWRSRLGDQRWGDDGVRCWRCQTPWRTSYLTWHYFFENYDPNFRSWPAWCKALQKGQLEKGQALQKGKPWKRASQDQEQWEAAKSWLGGCSFVSCVYAVSAVALSVTHVLQATAVAMSFLQCFMAQAFTLYSPNIVPEKGKGPWKRVKPCKGQWWNLWGKGQ